MPDSQVSGPPKTTSTHQKSAERGWMLDAPKTCFGSSRNTEMSMEISNYLVSWVVTYLGDLQPTYIGVIIYSLSSMDILVSWIRFCSLRGDSAPNQPKPTEKAVSLFRILKGTTMTTNLLAMVMKITLQVHGMIRTRESSFLGVSVSSFFPVRISERRFRNRNPEDSVSNRRSQSPRWRTHGGTDDGNPGSQKIRMVFAWWFKPWPFWDGEFTWPFQGVVSDLQRKRGWSLGTLNHLVNGVFRKDPMILK